MKNIALITAVALGLLAGPALAQSSNDTSGSAAALSDDQRAALVAILSGLPRQ